MFDAEVTAVFRDSNSHCALRVAEAEGVVHYVAIAEQDGAIQVDLFKMSAREFHHTFKEIPDYPVKKAAHHFLHPITAAIHVTPAAIRVLNSVAQSKEPIMNQHTETNGQSNVNATHAASVKTSTKAADKPKAAPVKDRKPTAAQQAKAKADAAKKAAAAKADAAKAKQKEKDEAAAKKAAAKGKAPPAAVKAAKAAKKAAKATPKKAVPAKKVAKLVRNPAHAAPAKKVAKKAADAAPRTTYADDQTLTVVGKENPFRSTLGERFQLIMDKKTTTVGAYVKKTDRRGDLGFFVGKGVLKIK